MKKKLVIISLFMGLFIILSACGNIDRGKSITAVGSSAMQPLVEAAGEEYSAERPGIFINVQGGGSGTGLSQVQSGAVEIGNSDLFAEEKSGVKADQLVDHKVAVVGITPIVNKAVNIESITIEQLADIFSGKITNWKELGGKDQDIVLINRATGSGTRFTFEKSVMKDAKTKQAQEQDSTGMVRQIVRDTPGAISYVAFAYVTEDVDTLKLNNIAPTEKNVKNNKWPIWSYEHMYTKGEPKGLTKEFLDYIQSENVQQKLVPKLGYIPISEMKVERGIDGAVHSVK